MASSKAFKDFFAKYSDSTGVIPVNGVQDLCSDIGISPLDPVSLVLAWHCRASVMGVFTKEELARGLAELKLSKWTVKSLSDAVDGMRSELLDPTTCKQVYLFLFGFALDGTAKVLPMEDCIAYWELLLRPHFKHLDLWIEFCRNYKKQFVSRDTWTMLWEFATQVDDNFQNYDMDGAWPVMLDEFVESCSESVKLKVQSTSKP